MIRQKSIYLCFFMFWAFLFYIFLKGIANSTILACDRSDRQPTHGRSVTWPVTHGGSVTWLVTNGWLVTWSVTHGQSVMWSVTCSSIINTLPEFIILLKGNTAKIILNQKTSWHSNEKNDCSDFFLVENKLKKCNQKVFH